MASDKQNKHKDFDDLIADSAQMQEFGYSERAWEMMEYKLDQHTLKKRRKRLLLLLILIGVSSGALWMKNQQLSAKTSEKGAAIETLATQTIQPTETIIEDANNSTTEEIKVIETKEKNTFVKKRKAKIVRKQKKPFNTTIPLSESKTTVTLEKASQDIKVGKSTHNRLTRDLQTLATTHIQQLPMNKVSIEPPVYAKAQDVSTTQSNWAIIASAAPEWSSVRYNTRPTRGWRVGGDIAYGLSDRWSVGIGVGLSKKLYEGRGNDFNNKEGWTEDISPMAMKAKCYIVDVPLSAIYHLNGRGENGFYFSGGLSSYFINSEWYGFEYTEADRQLLKSRGSTPLDEITINKSSNNHWIGAGQLSVGYQHRISDHLHIGVAPYISIPLTGIGEGAVRLHSAGIKMSVQLRP